MTTHSCLVAPLLAACTLGMACANRSPLPADGPPTAEDRAEDSTVSDPWAERGSVTATPCPQHSLLVRAAAPEPGGPIATLVIERRGDGMREKATCLRVGETSALLAPGEEVRVNVAADAEKFTRITVGASDVLLPVEPGGTVELGDHPCFGWAFTSAWLDPFGVDGSHAYCRAPDATCKEGYTAAGPPGPVQDALCADTRDDHSERRCVRNATLRFVAPGLALRETGDEAGTPVPAGSSVEVGPSLMPARCDLPELVAGADRVLVAAPAGGRLEVQRHGEQIEVVARP